MTKQDNRLCLYPDCVNYSLRATDYCCTGCRWDHEDSKLRKKATPLTAQVKRPPLPKVGTDETLQALAKVTKELALLLKGEACDHRAGICFCDAFRAQEEAFLILGRAGGNTIDSPYRSAWEAARDSWKA